jgi:hypothetical protein
VHEVAPISSGATSCTLRAKKRQSSLRSCMGMLRCDGTAVALRQHSWNF